MPKTQRIILSFIIAPLAAPFVFLLCGIVVSILEGSPLTTTSEPIEELLLGLAGVSIIVLPVSYIAMLALGIPTILTLQKYGKLSLLWLVIVAALEGIIAISLFFGFFSSFSLSSLFGDNVILMRTIIGAAMAIGVAVTFWYVSGHNHRFHGTSALTRRLP